MAKKQGICKNVDGCTLAADKVIQEADSTQFVCEECGKPLYELSPKKEGGKGARNKGGNNKIVLYASIAAVVLALGAGGYFLFFGKDEPVIVTVESVAVTPAELLLQQSKTSQLTAEVFPEDATDKTIVWTSSDSTVVRILDQNGQIEAKRAGKAVVTATVGGKEAFCSITVKKSGDGTGGGKDLGWGIYNGPMQNGQPHGIGGEVIVKQTYTIDLKKMSGEKKYLNRGDKIVSGKFKNGRLVGGMIHYADGRQESFNIGS